MTYSCLPTASSRELGHIPPTKVEVGVPGLSVGDLVDMGDHRWRVEAIIWRELPHKPVALVPSVVLQAVGPSR